MRKTCLRVNGVIEVIAGQACVIFIATVDIGVIEGLFNLRAG